MNKEWLQERLKSWERVEEKKEIIPGPGPFQDSQGYPSLNSSTINYRWKRSFFGALMLTFTAMFWNVISFGVVGGMIYQIKVDGPITVNHVHYESVSQAFEAQPMIAAFAIFLIFPIIGIFLFYHTLCHWVNTTTFRYDGQYLDVSHSPLPVSGGHRLRRSSIEQFYVQKHVTRNKNSTTTSYRVKVILNDGPEVVFFDKAENYSEARILEQWAEKALGIEDRPTRGEVA